jgi:hypothetical protein
MKCARRGGGKKEIEGWRREMWQLAVRYRSPGYSAIWRGFSVSGLPAVPGEAFTTHATHGSIVLHIHARFLVCAIG